MRRLAVIALVALASALLPSCSSWDTGSSSIDDVERACVETVQTFARTAERCGDDYHTAYDSYLRAFAAGDCKNVTSIRDEDALRTRCFPSVRSAECALFGQTSLDPTCSKQLQRSQ